MSCLQCAAPLPAGRADRRFCSDACRQRAYRGRRRPLTRMPARPPRAQVVYECPSCGARLLGEQRCEECGLFCRRVGAGGPCPHCEEPVALEDLIDAAAS